MSDPRLSDPRVAVPLNRAYRLLNHGPTVLVSAAHGGARNVMAAAWVMPVDFDPPKIAIVIDRPTRTRALAEASGRITLTVPQVTAAALVTAVGNVSGHAVDKFARWSIGTLDPAGLHIAAGVAWLDCELMDEPGIAQRHDLFVARVTAAFADPRAFRDGRWVGESPEFRTLHHIAGGTYFATGDQVAAPVPDGA